MRGDLERMFVPRALQMELQDIKRKYDDEYKKHYPYHLDAAYDDEDGILRL
jgi:hypothetical protein